MFNQDVKNYIIDNICNVDFLDIEFLDELRKVITSNNDFAYRILFDKKVFSPVEIFYLFTGKDLIKKCLLI